MTPADDPPRPDDNQRWTDADSERFALVTGLVTKVLAGLG